MRSPEAEAVYRRLVGAETVYFTHPPSIQVEAGCKVFVDLRNGQMASMEIKEGDPRPAWGAIISPQTLEIHELIFDPPDVPQ